ncbi:hypothetical protein BLNAU_11474 [Blattamonas nauphoetae]|uniref:Uncharacterized protein n=1 Tax=Blattamonas nauphoetae TaxID=2049346 RepID=A0ABQ9XQU2_9EUKA|nr:hypothetical protein BLNAU_11474 [Blattamonas nauphoetae]
MEMYPERVLKNFDFKHEKVGITRWRETPPVLVEAVAVGCVRHYIGRVRHETIIYGIAKGSNLVELLQMRQLKFISGIAKGSNLVELLQMRQLKFSSCDTVTDITKVIA